MTREEDYVRVRKNDLSLMVFGLFECDDDYIEQEVLHYARAALRDALIYKGEDGKLQYHTVKLHNIKRVKRD